MRVNHGTVALMLSATVLTSASAMTGCAGGSLVYDSDWRDYHPWNRYENRITGSGRSEPTVITRRSRDGVPQISARPGVGATFNPTARIGAVPKDSPRKVAPDPRLVERWSPSGAAPNEPTCHLG